mgnify:CR=1 FL=1
MAFIAHHVAEYFQQSPVSLKIRGMTRNDILREAVTDVITTTVHGRQERPFLDRKKVVAALDGRLHPLGMECLRWSIEHAETSPTVAQLADGLARRNGWTPKK